MDGGRMTLPSVGASRSLQKSTWTCRPWQICGAMYVEEWGTSPGTVLPPTVKAAARVGNREAREAKGDPRAAGKGGKAA